MAAVSHNAHNTDDYDIIDGEEHHDREQNNLSSLRVNGVGSKGKVDFGAQLKRTPQQKRRTVVRHPEDSPDYRGHLKKSEGTIAVKPVLPRGEPRTNGEAKPRMTAEELMKIANSAIQDVDEKDKRDMAARRGVGQSKTVSAGTAFEGFKPSNDDAEKLTDFKSVLRRSMRKGSPPTLVKKEEEKPEWLQQKRAVKLTDIENKVGKSKGTGESPSWADKVHKVTARQRVTELEHRKALTHPGTETPEWANKVPKDSRDILAKTAQRFKGRGNQEDKPNYRGVLKSTNSPDERKNSRGSSGRYSE